MIELLMLAEIAGNWEWLLIGFLVFIGVYLLRRYELNRLKLREQLRLEMVKTESLGKMDKLKSHFFADISHELRTPLTLVIGQIESVIEMAPPETKSKLQMAQRHGSRLLLLIDQLLELSMLDAHSIKLHFSGHNIVSFLKSLFLSFEPIAATRDITLEFHAEEEEIYMQFDPERIEQAVCNLISNAFKFTGSPGLITLEIKDDNTGNVEIRVGDSGPGIDAGDKSFIFSRFYRGEGAVKRKNQGAGIGLAITKELVELHKGTISVENKPLSGAVFIIRLPVKQSLSDDENANQMLSNLTPDHGNKLNDYIGVNDEPKNSVSDTAESSALILLVEDNEDVRSFIRQQLQEEYRLKEAVNGIEGIHFAQELIPDLIITDLMMPEADGFQLCSKLRKDIRTSHIPIIMLTARSGIDDKLEGLGKGIDEYITKPFNSRELKVRVKNLLAQRTLLRSRFSTSTIFKPSEITVIPIDQLFLEKVVNLIEHNLQDAAYNVEIIANEMNMSISQLNRKLHALVGQTAGQILRSMRLQRAADLLKKKAETVAGICYIVGFNDHAYFSRAFKKQFGCTPTEYMK